MADKFLSTLEALCNANPEICSKVLSNSTFFNTSGKKKQKGKGALMRNIGLCLLNPKFTEIVHQYLRPWLLELIGWCASLVATVNTKGFNSAAHSALCVVFSKLVDDDSIRRFACNYLKEYPSPYYHLTQHTETPVSKKVKLDYEIPAVTEVDILEATYYLILNLGSDISNNWNLKDLLIYLQHQNEEVRWFTCSCLAMLVKMSEEEKNAFILRYVSSGCHTQMMTSCFSKQCLGYHSGPVEGDCLTSKYTCKIGFVTLSCSQKAKMKEEGGLVPLASTNANLEAIALGISANCPVLIEGVVGSGKTCLVEQLAKLTGRNSAPQLTKIQLGDQVDSKTLIGTYRCTANPGEFIWQAGSLTQAVMEGHWLLLEDIDFATLDIISLLIPLLELKSLPVPGHGNVKAHPNFQVFATRRILPAGCRMRVGSAGLLEKLWSKVSLQPLTSSELKTLICHKWPELESISAKLVEVYLVLSSGQHNDTIACRDCMQCNLSTLTSTKASGRFVSVRDLIKWCSRMASQLHEKDLNLRAFQEALDCFCASIPDPEKRLSFALHVGSHLNVNEASVVFYAQNYKPEIFVRGTRFSVGPRGELERRKSQHISVLSLPKSTFSKTRLSSCLLEKVTVAVMRKEPVLIVGETGTGKTSTIQYLAQQTNHPLKVINMNQQSDSSDLLGGFKPIDVKTIASPLRNEFEDLFVNTFSAKLNNKFLKHIMTVFAHQRWKDMFSLMKHSFSKAIEKLSGEQRIHEEDSASTNTSAKTGKTPKRTAEQTSFLLQKWSEFQLKLKDAMDRVERVKSSLAFAFIEGTLVKAVQEGSWVLLDEINLASADTLECLTGLLESSLGSLTLHERGDNTPVSRHEDFRLFACMNPATDIGKKELPAGLRNRFTEFFMNEFQDVEDLKLIVRDYLKELNPSPSCVKGIVKFYKEVKMLAENDLTDGTGHKPHFSLRTLCRALVVARNNPCKNLPRSLYEAFCLSFLTQLDRSSYPKVVSLIRSRILGDFGSSISSSTRLDVLNAPIPCPGNPQNYVLVERFWVEKGDTEPQVPEEYILTQMVRENLRDLVRIVSIGRFPVLLQGDTSVGKTSLISYLAKLTGNNCVRINNHQHTDLQEYVGSYGPDENGKLVFKEGVLVKAMRNGHWIILDELNLAPTDVLEALNRLLDDNRELFVPEIETTVKAHKKFMLFATQNPPGLYGGRQVLSRAFRNRFVELHFNLIPSDELQIILQGRCQIPPSLSRRMVDVMKELQNRRRASNLFEGKQSFVTLRDLFRWAERYRLAPKVTGFYDWNQHMADEGYLVLAGKVRQEKETEAVIEVLKKHLKKTVKMENLFDLSSETSPVTKTLLERLSTVHGFEHIVWTRDMRRLFVLVSKALAFTEPVLLVGETGCGKTTVCQMIAAMEGQDLFAINCHMHTEGADFLGGLRPVRDRAAEGDDRLFEWVDGPLIEAMKKGGLFLADEISLADDSVLERINSILEPERTLLLSEKGEVNTEEAPSVDVIVAHDLFRLVGTMNPGGDYGKKELSPALRNRLTEIWCPKVEINRSSSDVELIIDHNLKESAGEGHSVTAKMLFFLKCLSRTELGTKVVISIRDILSWVTFINKVSREIANPLSVGAAYVHGACMVFLDSLGSGTTGSTVVNWRKIKDSSLQLLCWQAEQISSNPIDPKTFSDCEKAVFRNDTTTFGIEPFFINKGSLKPKNPPVFSFRAPRTCVNLLRILRGLQLTRPILLEGSPGVGKTSLVIALAKASHNDIVRINLSEQTDVSDLFGADLPVENSEGGRFAWRDGPLLKALKGGSWIVLDELNLASQSVLEGLNACFDHRGEIYVPELNKTFTIEHRSTKIFACQNPQYEGGARKGLPKSFLNRFTQVFVEPLSAADLEFILETVHPQISHEIVANMIRFNEILVQEIHERRAWGTKGGPWELNLRDMFRWCEIMLHNQKEGQKLNPGEYVQLIYSDRMRTQTDKEEVLRIYERVFPKDQFPLYRKAGTFFISSKTVQAGKSILPRNAAGNSFPGQHNAECFVLQHQTPFMESLINCINMNWMTILVGDSGEGKTALVHLIAQLAGERLETLAVNSQMDVTELLGGFEQADYGRALSELVEELQNIIWNLMRSSLLDIENGRNVKTTATFLSSVKEINTMISTKSQRTTSAETEHFKKCCQAVVLLIEQMIKEASKEDHVLNELKRLLGECQTLTDRVARSGVVSGGGGFEWVDSPLVKAVRNGYWLLIDGVNLCSPSVLDRLNGLLEPNGVLTINERGVIGESVPTITPHPNFRLFLTMDPLHGEISRAMRNRGIEVCVRGMWENEMDMTALLLSQGIHSEDIQKTLILTHLQIREALPRHESPTISCLSHAAALTRKMLHLGRSAEEAVDLSLHLVYVRNVGKMSLKDVVESKIKDSLQIFQKEDQVTSEKRLKITSSEVTKMKTDSDEEFSVNKFFLNARDLTQFSALGFPVQLSALVELIQSYEGAGSLWESIITRCQLPEPIPASKTRLPSVVFLSLTLLPLRQWEVLKTLLAQYGGDCAKLCNSLDSIMNDPSSCFQFIESVCDGELPSDPRFNLAALSKLDVCDDLNMNSIANKASMGLWIKVVNNLNNKEDVFERSHLTSTAKKINEMTLVELSEKIAEGSVGKKMIHHPCLEQLYPVLSGISNFMSSLADNTEVILGDDEFFKLREAWAWKERLETFCSQVVSEGSFHIFLPQIAFHWKQLQDRLLNEVPLLWKSGFCDDLVQRVNKMKQAFHSHCSPIHEVVPELRNKLKPPLPFDSEASASAFSRLSDVADNLNLPLKKQTEKKAVAVLASSKAREMKCVLVNVTHSLAEKPSDSSQIMHEIRNLEDNFSTLFLAKNMNLPKLSSSVKLWPFFDYLLSRQVCLAHSKSDDGKVIDNLCMETLTKGSTIPFLYISNSNSSKSLEAVALYLFNISHTAVLSPCKYLNFDLNETHNNCSGALLPWNGEETTVYSPMGCVLTYIILVGFCKQDEEVGDMSVGNYSERVIQLNEVRKTLWQNWTTLTTPSNSYNNSYKLGVVTFVSELLGSLLKTLALPSSNTTNLHQIVNQCELNISEIKLVLGSKGISMFQEVLELSSCLKETSDMEEIELVAKLGISSGLLQAWLLSHTEPLDPAHERFLLKTYCESELDETKDILLLHKWIKVLRFCQTSEALHPHVPFYLARVRELESNVKELSQLVAYRPDSSQYGEIVQEISHFMKTVFLHTMIISLRDRLTNEVNRSESVLQECEKTLQSCDYFVRKMVKTYPLYIDLVIPLLHGVVTVCEGLRVLMVMARNKRLSRDMNRKMVFELNETANFDDCLSKVLHFPAMRNIREKPEDDLDRMMSIQSGITGLIEATEALSPYHAQCQILSLRTMLYEVYNKVVTTSFFSKETFTVLKNLLENVIECWKEQESKRKQKELEDESLFQYKPKTLAISETEEEETEREYRELFPDYNEEFDDLDDTLNEMDDSETNDDKPNNDNLVNQGDKDIPNISGELLEEVVEIHKLLMSGCVDTDWMASEKNGSSKPVTPLSIRTHLVQLLMASVGPFATHRLDENALGALIMSNHVACSVAKKALTLSVVKKPFSYYHDSNLDEALKVRPLLESLDNKVNQLLESWPTHPSLLMIKKVILRVLLFPVSSPLIRFVIGLEMVLEKSQEWEKNAHRGVSLMTALTPITHQVILWRKMELKAWGSSLDMISYQAAIEANKLWPHLYASLVSLSEGNVDSDDVFGPLKKFMESASLGTYKKRLEILKSFHSHLCLELRYFPGEENERSTLEKLVALTWNLHCYYAQFLPQAEDTLQKMRKPIEKQLKDYINITRWNDINFFAVKDSVIKSRRTLHRHMRNWKKVVMQPFSCTLALNDPDISENTGEWDAEKKQAFPQVMVEMHNIEIEPVPGAEEGSLFHRLPSLTKRSSQLIKKAINEMKYKENVEAVEEMTGDIITAYRELILATSKAENLETKEERLKHLKDIMNRKRKNFAVLFKTLHHYGVSFTKGVRLWKDDYLDQCLIVPPMDVKVTLKRIEMCDQLETSWESCNNYFYKSVVRQTQLIQSLQQAHKDLKPDDINRLKGSVSHLMIFSQQLRRVMPELSGAIAKIDEMVTEIEKASKNYSEAAQEFDTRWNNIYHSMVCLSLLVTEEIELLKSFPNCDTLCKLKPTSDSLTEYQIQSVSTQMLTIHADLGHTITNALEVNKRLKNEAHFNLSSLTNIKILERVVSRVSEISERLLTAINGLSQEARGTSLSNPIMVWVQDWDTMKKDFSTWLSQVKTVNVDHYDVSSKVESCLMKILKSVENVYKFHCNERVNTVEEEEDTTSMISQGIVHSLIADYKHLNVSEIRESLCELLHDLKEGVNPSILTALGSMRPLILQYLTMCKSMLSSQIGSFRSLCKLQSVLQGIFLQIATKGFCRPQELDEAEGEGGTTQFGDDCPGLSEGQGQKDVSDRFESEDQLESALRKGEEEPEGNEELPEDDGIELSADFKGKLQERKEEQTEEEEEENDKEKEEEEEHDKEMGETEKGADKIDEKLWGDDKEEENEEGDDDDQKNDEHGPGDEQTTESSLVAKDDNKSKKQKEEKKKKKELEKMEEDRRIDIEEQDDEEETYGDDFRDGFGGEDHDKDNEDEEQMELDDDMALDDIEGDESGEEEGEGINPEIEEKGLFPEEERQPKDKGEDPDKEEEDPKKDEEKEEEEGKENDEREVGEKANEEGNKGEEEEEEEGDKGEEKQQRMGPEEGDTKEEQENPTAEGDRALPSQDENATQEAEAADMEAHEASKDRTKSNPETAVGSQPDLDDEQKQEEQGEMGEQTDDTTGGGQSDSKTREDSHRGKTSALATEEDPLQANEQQNHPRKPGDVNEKKTLGDVEKEIHRGLMTKQTSGPKRERREKENDPEKDTEKEELGNRDAELYEHIEQAKDHADKQTVDAGTREEARLRPAPLEEEKEEEDKGEPEGIVDTLMEEIKDDKEDPKEETRKREADTEGKEGPDVKRMRGDRDPQTPDRDHKTVTEGDVVVEMVVERPITNEYYTKTDEEEVAAAIFGDDLVQTRENIEEAGDGDAQTGSDQWTEVEGKVSSMALQLCEQLRMILEPTEASKMKGDFRTGKRLNMRKVIPYIASQFRKDKIWLRRSQPNKRAYQVILAIDDSESMSEVNAYALARESVALVAKALTLLEVGQLGVISFGSKTRVLHSLHQPFSDRDGAKAFANLSFDQKRTNFAQMLEDAVALFAGAAVGGGRSNAPSETAQLLLILSDGQTHAHSEAVRAAIRTAREARVFIVFLVLDTTDNKYSFYDALVYDNGKLTSMLDKFPFPFFIVVRDLGGLPDAITDALRQWFEVVTANAH